MNLARKLSRVATKASIALGFIGRTTARIGWRQGLPIALRQALGKKQRTCELSNGVGDRVAVRLGRRETDLRVALDAWLGDALAAPEIDCSNARWIVDAGANAGFTTRWLAVRYPNATVIAIEPDADSVQMLRRNTADLTNVMIEEAALTDTAGVADLVDVGQGPWAMRVGAASDGSGRVVGSVQCTSLDELIAKYEIDRIGLLKIDIEGGEVEVFRSSAAWIDKVDAIATELHDRFRPGCTRALFDATAGFGHESLRGELMIMVREPSLS